MNCLVYQELQINKITDKSHQETVCDAAENKDIMKGNGKERGKDNKIGKQVEIGIKADKELNQDKNQDLNRDQDTNQDIDLDINVNYDQNYHFCNINLMYLNYLLLIYYLSFS